MCACMETHTQTHLSSLTVFHSLPLVTFLPLPPPPSSFSLLSVVAAPSFSLSVSPFAAATTAAPPSLPLAPHSTKRYQMTEKIIRFVPNSCVFLPIQGNILFFSLSRCCRELLWSLRRRKRERERELIVTLRHYFFTTFITSNSALVIHLFICLFFSICKFLPFISVHLRLLIRA